MLKFMPTEFIDLHLHSYYSDDGELSPIELVKKCRDYGVQIMAIADHNCARANIEGKKAALAAGIIYIPAIEIDCTFQATNFHILGYGIEYESVDFVNIEKNVKEQSLTTSLQMLLLTQELGFHITENDMVQVAQNSYWEDKWTGEMFAEVLLNKPEYQDHPLLLPYRPNGVRGDNSYVNFYWDYYSQGKPCYAKIEYPCLEQIVEIIHRNGGYAVLAHPGVNLKNHGVLLKQIVQTGIDGIEAFSSYHTQIQSFDFFSQAKHNKLFATCGSDYHGKTKPSIQIGKHGCLLSDDEIRNQLGKILNSL